MTVFGALRELVSQESFDLDLADGTRVADVLLATGLPDRVDIWVLVDGRRAGRDAPVPDGARITFFQPTGGG